MSVKDWAEAYRIAARSLTGESQPREMDKFTALRAAGVINDEVDAYSLLADLENATGALSRILTKIWVDWEKEFQPPALPLEFYLPEELLPADEDEGR
ncbi:MAG: hypothetical protein QW334_03760 [Thermofilum sp.]